MAQPSGRADPPSPKRRAVSAAAAPAAGGPPAWQHSPFTAPAAVAAASAAAAALPAGGSGQECPAGAVSMVSDPDCHKLQGHGCSSLCLLRGICSHCDTASIQTPAQPEGAVQSILSNISLSMLFSLALQEAASGRPAAYLPPPLPQRPPAPSAWALPPLPPSFEPRPRSATDQSDWQQPQQ